MTAESSLLPQYRIRHRLIGATVLLSLVAVVLPWLFDATPRNNDAMVQGEIRLHASDASMVLAKSAITTGQPSAIHSALSVDTIPSSVIKTASSAHISQLSSALPSSPGIASVPASAVQASGSITQSSVSTTHAVKPVVTTSLSLPTSDHLNSATKSVAQKGQALPLVKKTSVTHENTSVKTALAQKMEGGQAQFVVQLGVFSHAKNATELRQRLQANGIASYVDTLPSGAMRVRCGPFKTRGEANNALVSLRLLDVSATIVPTGR